MLTRARHNLEFIKSICEKIKPLTEPLGQIYKINTFGYRKFFPDGTGFNISTNFAWTKINREKFSHMIIPNYEEEVRSTLMRGETHFFRFGKPDRNNPFLNAIYNFDIWNTLSIYRKTGECVEAFYFTSTRENTNFIKEYNRNMILFERFSFYFKDKFSDIISPEIIKKESSPIVSPHIFKLNESMTSPNARSIQNFISDTPIHKFFLNIDGKEIRLSLQAFKCLALLSRGKTAKEIGRFLSISPRTVVGYIENIKHESKVGSRSHLIDLFLLNYTNDLDLLKNLENKTKKM